MTNEIAPVSFLRKILRHDADAGALFWTARPLEMFSDQRSCSTWNARYAGTRAFVSRTKKGYTQGHILGKTTYGHRVIWAMHHGKWPDGDIDHINGVRHDNKICNLRCVSRSVNLRNAMRSPRNTSGHNGVSWNVKCAAWRANIKINGKQIYLGQFQEISDAVAARKSAEAGLGFTERHGK